MMTMVDPRSSTVLVVEDDQDARELVCEILEDAGYQVIGAAHGREAIERLRGAKPCVILLDLTMPVMDGWSFREWQKQDPSAATIPVVVVSAINNLKDVAANLSAAGYVEKPVQLGPLLRAVATYC